MRDETTPDPNEMLPIDERIAKRIIRLVHDQGQPAPGLGDLILKIETKAGDTRQGSIVETDGESSIEGILLNDDQPPIRYDEMVWISFGHVL
jgi:hypothetical protein